MVLDDDKKVIENTIDDAFLNEDVLLSMGFKFLGESQNRGGTRAYLYTKENIGRVELFSQRLDMFKFKNALLPEIDRIFYVVITHTITNDLNISKKIETRYMITVGDLKELLTFRRLTAKICNLQHQAEDILSSKHLPTLRDLELRVSGLS